MAFALELIAKVIEGLTLLTLGERSIVTPDYS